MSLSDIAAKVKASLANVEAVVAAGNEAISAHQALLNDIQAEIVRVPTLSDLTDVVNRMAAGAAKT